jgi:chemotaxis signal transduction protein
MWTTPQAQDIVLGMDRRRNQIVSAVDPAAWARHAARQIIENHGDAAAIDTANYRECGFIIEAAKLALRDASIANQIGKGMEPPRGVEGD